MTAENNNQGSGKIVHICGYDVYGKQILNNVISYNEYYNEVQQWEDSRFRISIGLIKLSIKILNHNNELYSESENSFSPTDGKFIGSNSYKSNNLLPQKSLLDNKQLLLKLRELAKNGTSIPILASTICTDLGLERKVGILVLMYFKDAFFLELSEILPINGLSNFDAGTPAIDQDMNRSLLSAILKNISKWEMNKAQ